MRLVLLLLFFSASSAHAWTEAAINFRHSSGYCTDGAGETYQITSGGTNTESYPVTRGGFTFGWETGYTDSTRDGDSAKCTKLAGVNQTSGSAQMIWRLDLSSAGQTCTVRVACGRVDLAKSYCYFQIRDDVTALKTCSTSSGGANKYMDAMCTVHASDVAWNSSNVGFTSAFSSSILRIALGSGGADASESPLAHVSVSCSPPTSAVSVLNAMGEI